jgi:hypothetical protein
MALPNVQGSGGYNPKKLKVFGLSFHDGQLHLDLDPWNENDPKRKRKLFISLHEKRRL